MKKKIEDLTLKEMRSICADRFKKGFPYCKDCPIYCVCGLSPDDMKQENLDKEVEVEDNEIRNSKQKRKVSEFMSAILLPLKYHLKDEEQELLEIGLRIINNTEVEEDEDR